MTLEMTSLRTQWFLLGEAIRIFLIGYKGRLLRRAGKNRQNALLPHETSVDGRNDDKDNVIAESAVVFCGRSALCDRSNLPDG